MLTEWDSDCGRNPEDLLASDGDNGGVDGFHVEYGVWDSLTSTLANTNVLPANQIENVRYITIWLLLRADFPSRSYTNSTVYVLGQSDLKNIGPFNDSYRRLLLTRTVEVKNAVL
jgi:hypothetical protein